MYDQRSHQKEVEEWYHGNIKAYLWYYKPHQMCNINYERCCTTLPSFNDFPDDVILSPSRKEIGSYHILVNMEKYTETLARIRYMYRCNSKSRAKTLSELGVTENTQPRSQALPLPALSCTHENKMRKRRRGRAWSRTVTCMYFLFVVTN